VTAAGDWTIEKILEEKRLYDASVVYEKVGEEEGDRGWCLPGEMLGFGLRSSSILSTRSTCFTLSCSLLHLGSSHLFC
jgi:hypothetical protein